MEAKFSASNLDQVEKALADNDYLSAGNIPDANDANVFLNIKETPDRQKYPNLFAWYCFLSTFKTEVVQTWAKSAGGDKKKDEDVDLFADDDDDEIEKAKLQEIAQRQREEATHKKKKVTARSIVIFDVKVYEQEQDLDQLAKRIFEITMDGLTWRSEYKQVEIAYGMKKLQMGCTVEDDKVLTDDIFDKITEWEDEVQSVDVVSFQKV